LQLYVQTQYREELHAFQKHGVGLFDLGNQHVCTAREVATNIATIHIILNNRNNMEGAKCWYQKLKSDGGKMRFKCKRVTVKKYLVGRFQSPPSLGLVIIIQPAMS
jgi:hypothetical protein